MAAGKKKNWKTTVLGILTGAGILIAQAIAVLDSDPETVLSIGQITVALGAMGIGFFARDKDVSSKDSGAK